MRFAVDDELTLYRFHFVAEAQSVQLHGSHGHTELDRAGDAWVTEIELPSALRGVYWFALDGDDDWLQWQTDPGNPKRYVYPPGLHFTGEHQVVASLLEGPDAPPLRWSTPREDVPRGRVTVDEVDGRRVWSYAPPREPDALMLLFDGHEYTTLADTPAVLDNFLAEEGVAVAAVMPDSPETDRRFRELGGEPAFLAWCTEQLLPPFPRERTIVAGSSMGGLASLWFATERPDLFGGALVQSGGFPGMPVEVPAGLPTRWYLDVGVLEENLLTSTRELRDDLRAKGYDVAYQEFPGGHDFFWWQETLADGLRHLLSG